MPAGLWFCVSTVRVCWQLDDAGFDSGKFFGTVTQPASENSVTHSLATSGTSQHGDTVSDYDS